MVYKLLQLNIFQGKYYNNILEFLENNDYDIICLQEVSGNHAGFIKEDIFNEFKRKLNLGGEISINFNYPSDPSSYFGNVILHKKQIPSSNKREVWMKNYYETKNDELNWKDVPRSCLFVDLELDGKKVTIGSTHMAWGPTPLDEPYKIEQSNILLEEIKKIKNPLILCGDFNVTPDTKIVKSFSQVLENQTIQNGISSTLDLRNHKIKDIKPKGLAVDYILNSKGIRPVSFNLVEEELSDHRGLSFSFEV